MIQGKTISITARTIVNEVEIAKHGAVINIDENDISFYTTQVDKDACKEHRSILREDVAEFEDFVYSIQDQVQPKSE